MKGLRTLALGLTLALSMPLQAGVYSQDLSRCLVEGSTTEDKFLLVKWMFSAAAQHPAVGDIADLSEAQADLINRDAANLFVTLITEVCKETAVKAVKFEGPKALEGAFEVLGQVAATELFASPEVAKSLAGLESHVDNAKLEATFSGQ
ncbi:hypothetical protein [Ferrimonas balearica]|uniref:hypothetical protein n=1 Tax=Ferrimonas balearica TaxID=44012 RepID=UPI001C98EEED|nr:hypothetical protein [Ferrimonas balearica]MBY5991495.1 hypothetical protein [Ferrimonas balearica]